MIKPEVMERMKYTFDYPLPFEYVTLKIIV